MYSSSGFSHFSSQRKKCTSYGIEMMLRLSNLFNQMSDLCKNALVQFSKDLTLNQEFENFTKYRISDQKEQKLTALKKVHRHEQSPERSPFQKIRKRKLQQIKTELPKSRRQCDDELGIKLQFTQERIEQEPKAKQKPTRRSQRTQKGIRVQMPIIEERKEQEKPQHVQKLEKREPSGPKVSVKINLSKKNQEQKSLIEPLQTGNRLPRPKIKDPILLQNSELNQPLGKRQNRSNNKSSVVLSLSESQISSQPSDYKARRSSGQRRKSSSRRNKKEGGRRKSNKPELKQGEVGQKRPINGFMRFFQEVKDQIKKNNKISRLPDLSHLISVEWNKLSKKEQDKYNDAYYNEVQKMKEDGVELKKSQRRKKSRALVQKGESPKQLEQNQKQEVQQLLKDDSLQGKEREESPALDNQSSSPSPSQDEQSESSAKQGEPRKMLKVKRPTPKKLSSQHGEKEGLESSDQEEFSVSDEDDASSQGQQNSESSSVNQGKQSKSNSKTQNQGKSGDKKKE